MFSTRTHDSPQTKISAETLCLISPLLLLPLMAWEFSLSAPIPYYVAIIGANLGESIFGSVGHSGLAWSMLYLTPEGRGWWRDPRSRVTRVKVIGTAMVVFALSTAIFLLNSALVTNIFFTIYICMVLHHSLLQTQGLTFAYSYENGPSREERDKIEALHRKQKWAFRILIFLACFYPADNILRLGMLSSAPSKLAYFTVGSLTALWLVLSNRGLSQPQGRKMVFLARTFCVPFGIFSIFAALGVRILHSFEYILIYRKMMSYSSYKELFKKSQAVLISLGFFLAVSVIWIFFFFESSELRSDFEFSMDKPWWFSVLAGLTVTRAVMHFYMDRLIFQMSNPVSRQWWGPLLHGHSSAKPPMEKVG